MPRIFPRKFLIRFASAAALLGLLVAAGRADVTPGPLFGDHAVLQRDRLVPVWGCAGPGEPVSVTYRGKSVATVTGTDGCWSVILGPLAASGEGADLVIAGQNTVTLHDIVVGDVWLCSGQSNMGVPVSRALNPEQEAAAANFPLVRHIAVRNAVADSPATTLTTTGWLPASPGTAGRFTAVGYYFARDLHQRLGVPIGLVHSSFGGTRIEAWLSPSALAGDPAFAVVTQKWKEATVIPYAERTAAYDAALAAWKKEAEAAKAAGAESYAAFTEKHHQPSAPMGPQQGPSVLFNAMINPLVPYGLRGILWYQGESNVWSAGEYRRLFTALITSWRAHFGQPDLPFYWVQLANFENHQNWAWLREAQDQALALPHTGQAVAIDVGDPADIHPRNKQEVGRRLALIARAQLFGEAVEYSGPVFQAAQAKPGEMRLHFTHAGGGLVLRDVARSPFEIAGSDRVFHPATGKIEGSALVVSAPEVKDPVAVRYAFSSSPEADLYNAAGLPAAPFRTDNW